MSGIRLASDTQTLREIDGIRSMRERGIAVTEEREREIDDDDDDGNDGNDECGRPWTARPMSVDTLAGRPETARDRASERHAMTQHGLGQPPTTQVENPSGDDRPDHLPQSGLDLLLFGR